MDSMRKSSHLIPIKISSSRKEYANFYLREMTNGKAERTLRNLKDMLRGFMMNFKGNFDDHFPFIELAYNNSYHSIICITPFVAIYSRRCISHIVWFEVGKVSLIGPELVHEIMEKNKLIRERLKTTQSQQSS
ncbi:hypothetical protein MTR67_012217 [Solanum verrucosum]|uniref:Uncharacterized protein n=1 Tax=Solanum verrucosum TaxID=315347 RepID=A0AAF0TFS1_SOLVR|nr:hypothetical protein MTR67_012217 [Solanum verrucosum]